MRFEDLPIRRKLISIIMAISGVVLGLTCVSFVAYELVTFRQTMKDNLATLAEVVARNSTGALAFQNKEDAEEVLSALAAESHVMVAALYDKDGNLFASYFKRGHKEDLPAKPRRIGIFSDSESMILFQPVRAETELGFLYMKLDLKAFYDRLKLYALMVLIIVLISLSVAFGLSNALQRRISNPLSELADSARKVSELKSYGVRAKKYGRDELGQLTDAFNEMLEQIQQRDAALSEKEERLRLALDASQTGIWDRNLVTGRETWDSHTERIFGLKPGEFDGTPQMVESLIHSEDRPTLNRTLKDALETRGDFVIEFRVIWPDGSIRHVAARGKAIYNNQGVPQRITGVALDVTTRKNAEMALRESEEKYRKLSAELDERVKARTAELELTNNELEAFTYSVSHDLRAPLRHMAAYSQLLLEDHGKKLDSEAVRFLSRIRTSARNMGYLVDDLLNLARIGRQDLKREPTSLNKLVDEALTTLKPETEQRQIEWKIARLPIARCDPGLMKQVFVNILSNAVKYSRPRETAVIEVGQTQIDNETVIFIRDNGVGFNMEYSNKLFGVFERLHRQDEFEGTGVGLATVARIVGKHNGRIWAEAEENKGATFYFTIAGIKKG
ncbi:MAG: PAS domain-containing protein [Verrucomicrobia bacterium]|nr:PAS domain-containing protein [Verrucomicrobiota bacterium]